MSNAAFKRMLLNSVSNSSLIRNIRPRDSSIVFRRSETANEVWTIDKKVAKPAHPAQMYCPPTFAVHMLHPAIAELVLNSATSNLEI